VLFAVVVSILSFSLDLSLSFTLLTPFRYILLSLSEASFLVILTSK